MLNDDFWTRVERAEYLARRSLLALGLAYRPNDPRRQSIEIRWTLILVIANAYVWLA